LRRAFLLPGAGFFLGFAVARLRMVAGARRVDAIIRGIKEQDMCHAGEGLEKRHWSILQMRGTTADGPESLHPRVGGCVPEVTGAAKPSGNGRTAYAPRPETLECAGLTALFLFPPKQADRPSQSGVKPPHSKRRHAPGGSPS
jgi:hypothetical protein